MVKSTIVYFGSLAESKKGLQRTLIAFFVMWICLFFMFKSRSSISKVAVASAATALVLVSAIGVQLPRSLKEAALYGALVGLVVSVSIAATAGGYVFRKYGVCRDCRSGSNRALLSHRVAQLQVFFKDQIVV